MCVCVSVCVRECVCKCVYVYLHSQGVLRGLYVLADIEAGDIALNGGHYLPTVC